MSSNNEAQGNHIGILLSINKAAMEPASSITNLLDRILKVIGDTLNSSLCAFYEANKAGDFDFISGYQFESSYHGSCLIKLMKQQAQKSLQQQQIIFSNTGFQAVFYFIPITAYQSTGVLLLGFENEVDDFTVEIIESLVGTISSSLERFYLQQQIGYQYLSTVKSLVVAIEAKDIYTQGHSQRVSEYSKIIGTHLKLKDEQITELGVTGLVHDIGKIGVRDQVLNKPDKLSEDEFEAIKLHPEIGSKILEPLKVSENVMLGTLLHHKRYDLKGYPLNASIEKLPLVPCIIGVADAFDAMTSERSYKQTITKKAAIDELRRFRGTQFSPAIVDLIEELVSDNKI